MIPYIMDDTKSLTALVADNSNGLGRLPEATSLLVPEKRNNAFTAELIVPKTAKHFDKLHTGGILKIRANDDMVPQLFRIDAIEKDMDDATATLSLNHITYDLLKVVCAPFSAQGIANTLNGIVQNTFLANKYPFTLLTDITNTESNFNLEEPRSWREIFGGIEGSILDTFGGANNFCEIRWDNLQVQFLQHRGRNRGVVIEYGKNLTSTTQEESIANVYTGCVGYAVTEETGTVIGNVYQIVEAAYPKLLVVDFSNDFDTDNPPTVAKLSQLAEQYAVNNRINEPKVNLKVSFDILKDSGDEELLKVLNDVRLCDTVQVRFNELGIDVTAEVIEVEYDSLNEKYTSITLGSYSETFLDKLNEYEKALYNNIDFVKSFTVQQVNALASALREEIDGKITTYYQATAPANADEGDLWIDTDDNSLHRFDGTAWIAVQDADIQSALTLAGDAQATADRKIVTYAQNSAPSGNLDVGDLWMDTANGNIIYRWNGESWVNVRDGGIQSAYALAQNALNTAQSKVVTYYQAAEPTGATAGDLWIDTDDGNSLHRYNGTTWVNVDNADLAKALQDAADAQSTADSKIITFAQSTQPTATDIGDLWVDTGNNNALYRWNGTTWTKVQDSAAAEANAKSYADGKVTALNNTLNAAEIFNRLTDNGTIQGLYKYNGAIYLNGEYLNANGATIGGFAIDTNSIHTKNMAADSAADQAIWLSSATFSRAIGGTTRSNLKLAIGGNFGIDQSGTLYASNAILSGRLNTGGSNGTYANMYNGTLRGGGKDRNSDTIVEYGYISFPGGQYDSNDNIHNTMFLIGKDSIVLKGHIFTNPQYDISGNRHCLNGRLEIPWNGGLFHYDTNDKLEPKAGETIKGSTGVTLYFQNGMLVDVDPHGQQDNIYYGVMDSMLSPNSAA